ncbi:MAG: type 4a pilus biogenesis protein PilO [Candidatus Omnitrophica bacterium]|nr:type 4a pilus biogenesis protein PilO [Candidatus Omnitrophota bacterium]MBL7151157.1 type 4a pilus biogenesis protein PilO [Candidatus Omnitrophota bacterium]MBL7210495.1 type 4a pilus biogenesis protein PilO [Candidatus Omnitrophota bacterium]
MNEKIEISELIHKYKKPILNISVILAALLIAFRIYSGQEKDIAALKKQQEGETEKNLIAGNIVGLREKLNSYKQFLNKKDVLECVRKLNNIAARSSANIISIVPQGAKENSYYTSYPFNLTILAKNYHILAKFINELEKDSDIYLINLLTIIARDSGDLSGGYSELEAEIQISTILYKD